MLTSKEKGGICRVKFLTFLNDKGQKRKKYQYLLYTINDQYKDIVNNKYISK